jgi:hypothetical protein
MSNIRNLAEKKFGHQMSKKVHSKFFMVQKSESPTLSKHNKGQDMKELKMF